MGRIGRGGIYDRALTPLIIGVVLVMAVAVPVAAQETPAPATPAPATPAPATPAPATPAPAASPAPEASPAPTERPPRAGPRWQRAVPADTGRGFQLHDVIAGGPGFIAVGGAQPRREGADPRALIWLSEDGREWQAAPLFGDAGIGVVEAITATPDGFLAVGSGCCPDRAAVWRSADGFVWERVADSEALADATMVDVVDSDSGLVAVGCPATLECTGGRVWQSSDGGTTWEVAADMTMIPFSVAQTADGLVVAGTDSDLGGRGATATSPDGTTWTVTVADRRPGSFSDAETFADAVLVAGSERVSRRRDDGVLLQGPESAWQEVTSSRFEGSSFEGLGTSAGMVVLVGSARGGQRHGAVRPVEQRPRVVPPRPVPECARGRWCARERRGLLCRRDARRRRGGARGRSAGGLVQRARGGLLAASDASAAQGGKSPPGRSPERMRPFPSDAHVALMERLHSADRPVGLPAIGSRPRPSRGASQMASGFFSALRPAHANVETSSNTGGGRRRLRRRNRRQHRTYDT